MGLPCRSLWLPAESVSTTTLPFSSRSRSPRISFSLKRRCYQFGGYSIIGSDLAAKSLSASSFTSIVVSLMGSAGIGAGGSTTLTGYGAGSSTFFSTFFSGAGSSFLITLAGSGRAFFFSASSRALRSASASAASFSAFNLAKRSASSF